ncbi:GMC oxidoreductase-domain-containing protein [Infundibulicybe gibba]|nr:GMC oxidoreductase-domain-containing protein [Infundibulicybe gibba]
MLHHDAHIFSAISLDYVIVGGGTAGLALAARLSENPEVSVGVLEAGKYIPDMPEINIPGYFGKSIGNPDIDWMFSSIPQRGLHNRTIFQPRGKVLGGTSAMNFMSLSRGTKGEYDALEALGNPGWNWNNLLPYFKKFENLTMPPPAIAEKHGIQPDPEFHGTNGPIRVSFPRWYADLHEPFMEALGILGVPPNLEPENGHNIGRYVASTTVDPTTVTRNYSMNAYFEPNKDRPNLHVLTGAHVTKISTSSQPGTVVATAVQFQHEGKLFSVKAQREIILCAGALQTPQLLELSGIGNPRILQKFSIETVIDLPGVGENLQDHPYVPVIQEVTSETQTYEILEDPAVLGEQATLYGTKKEGIFSSPHSAFAMIPLAQYIDPGKDDGVPTRRGPPNQLSLQKRWFDDPEHAQLELILLPAWLPHEGTSPSPGVHYHTVIPVLPHPISRGSVHIGSADPLAPPAIDPTYLNNPVDLEMMVHAVKFSQKVMMTGSLKKCHVEFAQPGPDVTSSEDLKEWVTKYVALVRLPHIHDFTS